MKDNCGRSVGVGMGVVFGLASLRAQAETANRPPTTANAPAAESPSGGNGAGGGELEQITVTGYLIPRVGEGPQPVTTLDRNYIEKTGSQTVTDVLQNLPSAMRSEERRVGKECRSRWSPYH